MRRAEQTTPTAEPATPARKQAAPVLLADWELCAAPAAPRAIVALEVTMEDDVSPMRSWVGKLAPGAYVVEAVMAIAWPDPSVVKTMLLAADSAGRLCGTVIDAASILDVWTTLPHAPLAMSIERDGLAMSIEA